MSSSLQRIGAYSLLLLLWLALFHHTRVNAAPTVCELGGDFCFSAKVNNTTSTVDFLLQFKTPGWVAIGLAPKGSMSDADIWIVWIQPGSNSSQAMVSDRRSTSQTMPRPDSKQDVNVVGAAMQNNRYAVVVRRAIDTGDKDDYPFKNEQQTFIWALSRDPVNTGSRALTFDIHSDHGSRLYNVFDTSDAVLAPQKTPLSRSVSITIHGTLMFLAWGVFSYLGVFIARFMKNRLGIWWFRLHWGFMSLVAILSTAAFIVVFQYNSSGTHFTKSVHSMVGLIVFSVMWIQFLLGLIINQLFNPARGQIPWWDKLHWVLGYTMAFGGPVSILLGLIQYGSSWTLKAMYIVSWVVLIGLFAFGQKRYGQTHHHESGNSSLSKKQIDLNNYNLNFAEEPYGRSQVSPSRPPRPVQVNVDDDSSIHQDDEDDYPSLPKQGYRRTRDSHYSDHSRYSSNRDTLKRQ